MTVEDNVQIGGNHYKTDDPDQQHWNAMAAMQANYFQGVITKYIDRHRRKHGLEDLQKAEHYAKKYKQIIYSPFWSEYAVRTTIKLYLAKDELNITEVKAITAVLCNDMPTTIKLIEQLIEEYTGENPTSRYTNQD
jgi:hypothetical protein